MRFLCLLALVLCGAVAEARPWLLLFGSEGCEECEEIRGIWAEREDEGDDSAVLVYVSIDKDANYRFLARVEQALKIARPGTAFPIIFAGHKMAQGVQGFLELAPELDELMNEKQTHPILQPILEAVTSAKETIIAWNVPQENLVQPDSTLDSKVASRLLYLSEPGCQKCARQNLELNLLVKQNPKVQIDNYDVTTPEGQIYVRRVRQHFPALEESGNLAPIVVWGDGYVHGRLANAEELAASLKETKAEPFWTAEITVAEREALKSSQSRFLGGMIWANVIFAGLVDGINPCAFATIIFLISYLLYLKRGKRFVLYAGLFFCLGVFLSYLLFGVGLGFLVDKLQKYPLVKIAFYAVFALISFVLAILHLRDALRIKKTGKAEEMSMRLDTATHRKMHDRIHKWGKITGWLAMPGAALLGVVISSMEFVCTGQVYLPTIMSILSDGFHWKAFCGLLVYNIAFILPLLAVTFLAYRGVGAVSLAEFSKKHLVATKLAMTALFLLLAALMVCLAFWG